MKKYVKLLFNKDIKVPAEMGQASGNQLMSTPHDNLVELAGRVCYDSLGKGRTSALYHKHILEVDHGSVHEHANFTIQISNLTVIDYLSFCENILNRPGFFVTKHVHQLLTPKGGMTIDLRITTNVRAAREYFEFPLANKHGELLGTIIQQLAKSIAPMCMQEIPTATLPNFSATLVPAEHTAEIWVSLFFFNISRNISHELVRHKFQTAVSMRSTRFVDESGSALSWHPAFELIDQRWFIQIDKEDLALRDLYTSLSKDIEKILITTHRVDERIAKKQARGAARGLLPSSLSTELIFSANLDQWRWMIISRANSAADAEIRLVFNEVYALFMESEYKHAFADLKCRPAADGMGLHIYDPDTEPESKTETDTDTKKTKK